MKTIKEEAKEFLKKRNRQRGSMLITINEALNGLVDFASIAQRWIPVEEELPPIGIEVIVKERLNEHDIYIFNSIRDRLIKCQDNCITHWRPIELK